MSATTTPTTATTTRGPDLARLDRSLSLLVEGYDFGVKRFERWGTDAFPTRLLVQRAVVMRGAEATRQF
jgi:fatty-acid peroxygenase